MKIKDTRHLTRVIALKEGKKVQVSIGNIREIISILSDLFISNPETVKIIVNNGKRRARR